MKRRTFLSAAAALALPLPALAVAPKIATTPIAVAYEKIDSLYLIRRTVTVWVRGRGTAAVSILLEPSEPEPPLWPQFKRARALLRSTQGWWRP